MRASSAMFSLPEEPRDLERLARASRTRPATPSRRHASGRCASRPCWKSTRLPQTSSPFSSTTPVGAPVPRQGSAPPRCPRAPRPPPLRARPGQRLGDRPHPAARKAPGAHVAVHIAHRVMQEHIGRARRHRPQRRADDRGNRLIGLDRRMLEILVEEVRRSTSSRSGSCRTSALPTARTSACRARPVPHRSRGRKLDGSGGGAHQHRADEAAVAQDVAAE